MFPKDPNTPKNIKSFKPTDIEKMMLDITEEGDNTILNDIEGIPNAIERFKQRNLFHIALKKIKNLSNEE